MVSNIKESEISVNNTLEFKFTGHQYASYAVNSEMSFKTAVILDTGADHSMITLGCFDIHDDIRDYIISEIDRQEIEASDDKLADGSHIKTFPAIFDIVSIGGKNIYNFIFYLYINDSSNKNYAKFLLGDDFISCCSSHSTIGGPFIITEFDEQRYNIMHDKNMKMLDMHSIFMKYNNQYL